MVIVGFVMRCAAIALTCGAVAVMIAAGDVEMAVALAFAAACALFGAVIVEEL